MDSKAMWLGGVRSWLREYARRYNHSIQTDIRLCDEDKAIIDRAQKQTESAQEELLNWMAQDDKKGKENTFFKNYVVNTREYLKGEPSEPKKNDSAEVFIESFRIRQKIREQILEMVAVLPLHTQHSGLPVELVKFYTDSVDDHGLGGLASDLSRVCSIAPIVARDAVLDDNHPYQRLVNAAHRINTLMNDTTMPNHELIFPGENAYRQLLGMPEKHFFTLEEQLKSSRIKPWLDASFSFLCSLNRYDLGLKGAWNQPFQNTDEYNVYRMLLVKQLASLWDPKNQYVSLDHKQDIEKFARDKLKCEPLLAFTDVLNHNLLNAQSKENQLGLKLLHGRQLLALSGLEHAAAAIRLDMAYDVSVPSSAKMLIDIAAREFIKANSEQILFSYKNGLDHLVPDMAPGFYQAVELAIVSTRAFVQVLQNGPQSHLLQKTGSIHHYLQEVCKDLVELKLRILEEIKEDFPAAALTFDNPLASWAALYAKTQVLDAFQVELQKVLASLPPLADAAVVKAEEPVVKPVIVVEPLHSASPIVRPSTPVHEQPHHPVLENLENVVNDLFHHEHLHQQFSPPPGFTDEKPEDDKPLVFAEPPILATPQQLSDHVIEHIEPALVDVSIAPAPAVNIESPSEVLTAADIHPVTPTQVLPVAGSPLIRSASVDHLSTSFVDSTTRSGIKTPPHAHHGSIGDFLCHLNPLHHARKTPQPPSMLSVDSAVKTSTFVLAEEKVDPRFDAFLVKINKYILYENNEGKKEGKHGTNQEKVVAAERLRNVLVDLRHGKPLAAVPEWIDEPIYHKSRGLIGLIDAGLATLPGKPKSLRAFFEAPFASIEKKTSTLSMLHGLFGADETHASSESLAHGAANHTN